MCVCARVCVYDTHACMCMCMGVYRYITYDCTYMSLIYVSFTCPSRPI